VKNICDLTLCKNDNCKKAQNCLRFLAKPDKYQSYMNGKDDCDENNGYEYFLEVKMLNKC